METTQAPPQIPDTKLHGDSKHNPSHVPQHKCHLNIPLRHFVSNTNKPKLHESCSTKSKPYSMLQIKNFLCCVVKEKFHSFVLPKKYSVREINNFPKRYSVLVSFFLECFFLTFLNISLLLAFSLPLGMKWFLCILF